MADEKAKTRLSKLAVLSLLIPALLTIFPFVVLRLFTCIFGHYPSDRVNAVLDRISELLHLNRGSDFAVPVPTAITVFSAVALATTAIFRIRKSHGALRGYLCPVISLILIPLYFMENLYLTVFLFADMFL